MFPSRSNRRGRTAAARHARLGRGTSRRLRVEAMEGRLMLDATVLEFTPVELPAAVAQYGGDRVLTLGDAAPAVWVARLDGEGGYITTRYALGDALLNSDSALLASGVTGDTLNQLAYRLNAGHAYDGVAGVSNPVAWMKFGEVAIWGQELEPVAIMVTPESADVTEVFASAFADFSNNNTGAPGIGGDAEGDDGGGPISIQRILASNELELATDSHPSAAPTSLAAADAPNSIADLNLSSVAADSGQVSGEWARAMVFEMAGGEPDHVGRTGGGKHGLNTDVDSGSQVEGPLSAVDAARAKIPQRGAVISYAAAAAARGQGVIHPLPAQLTSAAVGQISPSAEHVILAGGPSGLASLASTSQRDQRLSNADSVATAGPVSPTAFADAFEQLCGSTTARIRSLADEPWRESFGATPLLMVLALERIAAGNSRRNRPDATAATVRRPKLRGTLELPERA